MVAVGGRARHATGSKLTANPACLRNKLVMRKKGGKPSEPGAIKDGNSRPTNASQGKTSHSPRPQRGRLIEGRLMAGFNGDQIALLRTIGQYPKDDAPRLIYADCLDENGDPLRAAFIRTHIRAGKLTGRAGNLLHQLLPEWLASLGLTDLRWRRYGRFVYLRFSLPAPAGTRRQPRRLVTLEWVRGFVEICRLEKADAIDGIGPALTRNEPAVRFTMGSVWKYEYEYGPADNYRRAIGRPGEVLACVIRREKVGLFFDHLRGSGGGARELVRYRRRTKESEQVFFGRVHRYVDEAETAAAAARELERTARLRSIDWWY